MVAPSQMAGSARNMHRNSPHKVSPEITTDSGNTSTNRIGPSTGILQMKYTIAIAMNTTSDTANSASPSRMNFGMHIRP